MKHTIASQSFTSGLLKVYPRPRLHSVYPRVLDASALLAYGQLYLLGSGFQALATLPGTLRCALKPSSGSSAIITTSLSQGALVLSDAVIACPISATAARQLGKRLVQHGFGLQAQLVLSPASSSQSGVPLVLPLVTAAVHSKAAEFVLSNQFSVQGTPTLRISAYSAAEKATPPAALRPVKLHLSPSTFVAEAASPP